MVCTHPLVIHLSAFSLRFLPGRLRFGSLLHFFPLRVLYMLNSLLRQTAEHVYQLGSYLVFLSQLASVPLGGSLRMGAQGKPWSKAPNTKQSVCVWVWFSYKHLLPGVEACDTGIAPVSILLSCIYTLPSAGYQQSSSDTWHKQLIKKNKKNKANPKAQL